MQYCPWPWKSVKIILTNPVINSKNHNDTVFNVNWSSHNDTSGNEFSLRCFVCQVIPAQTQAAVLVGCQGAGLMTIGAHGNYFQCQLFVTALGLMDIHRENPISHYMANTAATLVSLPKFMIGAYVSSASTCIIHFRNDEPQMLAEEGPIPTQGNNFNSDPTTNETLYKPPQRCNKEVLRHYAVKWSDKISKTDRHKHFILPNKISASRTAFYRCLQFERMWNRLLGLATVMQHRIELEKTDSLPTHWTPLCTGSKAI